MPQNQHQTHKNNACKYNLVKDRLVQSLEAGKSARECAGELGISVATANRYKCCISTEFGKVFSTQEELRFIERQRVKADHMRKALSENISQAESDKTPMPSQKTGGKK
jgi:hypothetical protein